MEKAIRLVSGVVLVLSAFNAFAETQENQQKNTLNSSTVNQEGEVNIDGSLQQQQRGLEIELEIELGSDGGGNNSPS